MRHHCRLTEILNHPTKTPSASTLLHHLFCIPLPPFVAVLPHRQAVVALLNALATSLAHLVVPVNVLDLASDFALVLVPASEAPPRKLF